MRLKIKNIFVLITVLVAAKLGTKQTFQKKTVEFLLREIIKKTVGFFSLG
jgi:hypothetical protein